MKISKEKMKKIKLYLAETILVCFGYVWIMFTYASFYLFIISGYEFQGFFLIGLFSFIIAVMGYRALRNYKEKEGIE